MNKHSELELKWAADHVSADRFVPSIRKMFENAQYGSYTGTDHYYRRGDAVLRYRFDHGGGVQEFTTKQRKSSESIRDRVEVNVILDSNNAPGTVDALAQALGFVPETSLTKRSHVFHVEFGPATVVIAYYDVEMAAPACGSPSKSIAPIRTFIEVEIEQDDDVPQAQAEGLLDLFRDAMTHRFGLNAPLNESLYEMYTGRQYETAKASA